MLDGGPCTVGLESTIVEVFEDENQVSQWRILREGMLSHAQLTQYAQVASLDQTEQPRVPGQHRLHYAPVTSLQVIASREALISESETLIAQSKKVGAMLIGTGSVPGCTVLNLSQSPEAYAQALYAALHQLDALGLDTILVEQPPSTDGWAAILDRLTRAAHR